MTSGSYVDEEKEIDENILSTKDVLSTDKEKVNTAKVNALSTVGGKRETADYPHRALKNKGIVDSGCSRHMTGNKAFCLEYPHQKFFVK
ncbi:hypothetical protein Tco_0185913 [Tanacetum coccineum]